MRKGRMKGRKEKGKEKRVKEGKRRRKRVLYLLSNKTLKVRGPL